MARQAGTSIENNFSQGLITETTALSFPEKACTETYDCIFHRTGKIFRRNGFEFETSASSTAVTYVPGQATAEYLWTAAGGVGTKNIVVVQQANKIYFYDVLDTDSISSHIRAETITLSTYLPSGSANVAATYPCSFSQGNGDLFIVNDAISPLYVKYDATANTLTTTAITIQVRDFDGLTSEVATILTRPTDSVASLKSGKPNHYYNLINQGWYASGADALTQWDAARADMPAMADVPALFRSSETDTFDPNKVNAKDTGNVPAPKGHFILTAWNPDRGAALTAEGFTGVSFGTTQVALSVTSGSSIFFPSVGSWANPTYAWDGTVNVTATNCSNYNNASSGVTYALGKTLPSSSPISQAIVYGSSDQGFINASNPSMDLYLYAKQGSAPTTATDGTLLASASFTDTSNESGGRTLTSSDTSTVWDHAWIAFRQSTGGVRSFFFGEIVFYNQITSGAESVATLQRPSSVAFFAGRVWYAGLEAQGYSNNIYFSQIIQNRSQYGECYQKNDPAGEYYNDLVSDDGGVIKILEIGSVNKLFSTRSALFVFASNGVWMISGTSGTGFKATDYVVRRLSNVGTVSRLSFVDFKGIPIWWAEDGIYTTQFDPQTESYSVANTTLKTIKSFILDIPDANRQYVKATYDPINDYVYWLYNDSDTPYHNYDYNKVLVMNGATGSMFPWTISSSATNGVRGVLYVADPTIETLPIVKFISVSAYSDSSESITFAEASNTDYMDWPAQENTSYLSYFITGYKVHGDTQRYFQPNYLYIFMETETDASLYVQGIYDFTNSGNSGKWSSVQQCYHSNLSTNRDVSIRRLKVRGKGRAIQFKYKSEEGKPFTCLGWSVMESSNAGI